MKGKKTIVVGLAILLSLSISTVTSKNDKLSVVYTFESTLGGCGEFLIKDTQVLAIPGEPLTPYKAARILLPQGTEAKNIKVNTGTPVVQEGFDIPWGQPPCTFSDIPVTVGRNEDIYTSDSLYPKEVFQVIGVDYCKGFAILNLHLFPVQYKPKSGTVIFYPEMTVEVQFGKGTKNELYRGLVSDKEDVRGMVDNPDVLATYEDGPAPLATEEYIIITNDTMLSAFQTLATWKAGWVNGATVYTVAWISSNYTGTDNQMKIRNFIIEKYNNNGCKYVLLGGDTAAVPYRGFYVSTGGYTDSDMLADMYFAHLDGTHNADGDSYYGETNDGVDFGAEVAVGRAPCQTLAEAQNFVNKVITYECADKPKRVLLHQSRVQAGNTPDSRCLAYGCDDYIPGDYTIDYLFEEDGTVSKSVWISHWAQNPVAVAHIGHGNTDVYYINYEVGGTVAWYNTDIASMTNTFWPWTTSVACITGQIEANDCLAEAYVMDCNNGAIAAIYNDNYGWFNTGNACMYSGEFCINEFRACWSDGKQKLGDMLNKARSYLASSAESNSTYRWCFYERNLVGDPESPCLTKRGGCGGDSVTITNPSNGSTVSGTVSVTTSTTGSIDEVKFYIDGILVKDDTSLPFDYSWDTTTYCDDAYTILAEGYVAGTLADTDSVIVTVNNGSYLINIANPPQQGETVSCTVTIDVETQCIDILEFYIDGVLVFTDFAEPFQYDWDTCLFADGPHTVEVRGYSSGILKGSDSAIYDVDHYYVRVTDPQAGEECSGTVTITVEANCVDTVKLYIDDELKLTETIDPPHEGGTVQYEWNTLIYSNEHPHTITVKGYESGQLKRSQTITVQVYNPHIKITSPEEGQTVSGTVTIETETDSEVKVVMFYIDGGWLCTDTSAPFECEWDTCSYPNGQHTISAWAYGTEPLSDSGEVLDVAIGHDQVTVQVDNPCIEILTPEPGQEVYGHFLITTEAGDCVEWVEFHIDGSYKDTDFSSPFECAWNTFDYAEDQSHTISVKAYHQGVMMCEREVTVIVNNYYVEILAPSEGEVSGTVDITVYARGVDKIQYYFKECCIYNYDIQESDEPPYHYSWDTTQFSNGPCTISVKGYKSFELKAEDSINCTISSQSTILLLGLLAGATKFVKKRH
jgi:hypothetical protein